MKKISSLTGVYLFKVADKSLKTIIEEKGRMEILTYTVSAGIYCNLRETKHLYKNSFEIITHGINLKRSNILSIMKLEDVIKDGYNKKR